MTRPFVTAGPVALPSRPLTLRWRRYQLRRASSSDSVNSEVDAAGWLRYEHDLAELSRRFAERTSTVEWRTTISLVALTSYFDEEVGIRGRGRKRASSNRDSISRLATASPAPPPQVQNDQHER